MALFGREKIGLPIDVLLAAADKAQELIDELHIEDPSNVTFEQAGMLDGRKIIKDFLDHNEWGLGFDHLLYMIHESEIRFPEIDLRELHSAARIYGVNNPYIHDSKVH